MNLSALARWEAAILASIAGATGTIEERDAQITRSGMYAEYPAIFASYLDLARGGGEAATALEALKRAVFLAWWSSTALPVSTGVTELAEGQVRELMMELDSAIRSGRVDDELRMMLAWYRDNFGYVFEHFGPVRSLDGFIRDIASSEIRRQGAALIRVDDRGQMGRYWRGVLSEAGA